MPRTTGTGAPNRRRILVVALAAVSCAAALTACGSSGRSNHGSGSSSDVAGIKFADCMRSHGVPSFPDPNSHGAFDSANFDPTSPAFQTASKACLSLQPTGPVSAVPGGH